MDNENNDTAVPETAENDVFVVHESVKLNYGIAGFFMILFLVAITAGFNLLAFVPLITAISFFAKGVNNREALSVDCNGIYQDKKLVTDWNHFAEAYISQATEPGETEDNFVLIVRYFKDGIEGNFKQTIALTNTQNKSEEEVLEAIRRFYQLSLGQVTAIQQPLQIGEHNP